MYKKVVVVFLGVVILFALAGCGVREKIADKVTENITEGIIEKMAGDDVDVNLDDGTVTIEGEEGEEWSLGGGEWPEGQAADLIPEFTKGTITSVMNSSEGCWISIEEVEEQDYLQYVEDLKNAGFDQNTTEYSDEASVLYGASLDENNNTSVLVSLSDDGVLVIQVVVSE